MRRQRYQEQSNPLLYDVQHERDDDNQMSGARVRTREVHLLRHIGVKNRSKDEENGVRYLVRIPKPMRSFIPDSVILRHTCRYTPTRQDPFVGLGLSMP